VIALYDIRIGRRGTTWLTTTLSTASTYLLPSHAILRLHTLALLRRHKPALLSRKLSIVGLTAYRTVVRGLVTGGMLRLAMRDIIVRHRTVGSSVRATAPFVIRYPLVIVLIWVLEYDVKGVQKTWKEA
jgi:hypothetical protein